MARPFSLALIVTAGSLLPLAGSAAAAKPAVLFHGGAPHAAYVTRPLHELGIEVGACPAGKLAETLAAGTFNVVVVGTLTETERQAVDAFLAKGGGVLACNPVSYPREADFNRTCEWLAAKGARPRWEMLQDSDKANVVSVTFGSLSWTNAVQPPVSAGIRGLLVQTSGSTTGIEPAMSYDFGPDWTVTVRGATSMKTVTEVRNDVALKPWLPKDPVAESPALMGVRQSGAGRLAVIPFRDYWIFFPPPNCPPSEAMLSYDRGEKKSDWLRLFANTFQWLSEPSMKAGLGGATTPEAVLTPPVQAWEIPAELDWTKAVKPLAEEGDAPQNPGLIGARTALSGGTGTVADYAAAAKAAGLRFIVFLEDSLKMDPAAWDELVKQCAAATGPEFVAVPGLTYEDAQGNHLYVFGDQVRFPKASMLLPDKRLATLDTMRSRAYFDYINEYIGQKAIVGFWNHRNNFLHFSDYKLYNSFPIHTAQDGKPLDNALAEYLYWQDIGGLQAVLAFEMISKPDLVAERAKNGWRVVWNRELKHLAEGKWHEGAWSFSGMGSQYISSGPSILVWRTPNNLIGANGQWWRPDLWQFRLRLRVASDVGLKCVQVMDGDRQILRRWQCNGEKRFERELLLSNCQQIASTLLVEDVKGGQAISMAYWNRNLNMEEFFCSDRCNILGSCRLRRKDNGTQYWTPVGFQGNMGNTPSKGRIVPEVTPSVGLTANSPTVPTDGAPLGLPAITLHLGIEVPGELPNPFSFPSTYLVGPEIAIGQINYALAYDPAEYKATTSPLGHAYKQPQDGYGNSWGSWHRLVPNRVLDGYSRFHACNWLTEGFRVGWFETQATLKEPVNVLGGKGLRIGYSEGVVYCEGRPVDVKSGAPTRGAFGRGTYALMPHAAGATAIIGMDPGVYYESDGKNLQLFYSPAYAAGSGGNLAMPRGTQIRYRIAFAGADGRTTREQMQAFVDRFGISTPGKAAYRATFKDGQQVDNYLFWHLEAGTGGAVVANLPKTALPGFLTTIVDGLNDNWTVQLLDRSRPWPNHRALPIRDGRAYAEIDSNDSAQELFIGHPVTADNHDLRLTVTWLAKGTWWIEAHNPSGQAVKAKLKSHPAWNAFRFAESADLASGASQTWTVAGR